MTDQGPRELLCDPVKCTVCGGVYAGEGEIQYIREHGVCRAHPDPELEEWE